MAERIHNSEIWDIPDEVIARYVDDFSREVNDGNRLELYPRKPGSKGPIMPPSRRSFAAQAAPRYFPRPVERLTPDEQNTPESSV